MRSRDPGEDDSHLPYNSAHRGGMSFDETVSRSPFLHSVVFVFVTAVLVVGTAWVWLTVPVPSDGIDSVQRYVGPFALLALDYCCWSITRPARSRGGRHVKDGE